MGHMRGLGTARDYQVTDGNLGYGVCINLFLYIYPNFTTTKSLKKVIMRRIDTFEPKHKKFIYNPTILTTSFFSEVDAL